MLINMLPKKNIIVPKKKYNMEDFSFLKKE